MKDLNYFPLDVESNIYGMTTLEFDDKTSKVLVATLDCQIYCINYNKFKPYTREVEFTYIPNGAKIISIGALKRGFNDFVIGITHSLTPSAQKNSSRQSTGLSSREISDYSRLTTYYLNIYASGSTTSNFDLDYVAQGCQTIRLKYVPYHLYQTELITVLDHATMKIKKTPYWLLSGGDNSIHAFCEDKPYQSFNEVPISDCFPELSTINGLVLWLDLINIESGLQRAVASGFEDGSVKLYHSVFSATSNTFELVKESTFDVYTTIVPCVRLFRVQSNRESLLRSHLNPKDSTNRRLVGLNLLVVSSTESSLLFEDVLNNGLNARTALPHSRRLDCSVTATVDDINADGLNEILIGTHGRELLTYQFDLNRNNYCLSDTKELNHPIFAISVLDLTGDAMKDVVILVASGVLLMQAAIKDVIDKCRQRIENILSLMK